MSGNRQTSESLPDDSGASGPDMSVEGQARRLGWYPKEKFRGNPDDWIPADRFVERAQNELPVLKENLRRIDAAYALAERNNGTLQSQVAQLNSRLEDIGTAFDAMRDLSTKAEQRGYDRALTALKQKAKAAAEDGDAAAVEAAMTETAELVASRVKPDEPPAAGTKKPTDRAPARDDSGVQVDLVAKAWGESPERAWYRDNRGMNGFANGIYEDLLKDPETRTLSTGEKLKRVDRAVEQAFPRYFNRNQQVNNRGSAAVDEPREPADRGPGNGRSFDDLPAAAKKQYEVTAKEIKNRWGNKPNFKPYSKDEFADIYFGPVREDV